ncbi:uncharacterized protein LOC143033946 isoform X2 [Oratosquilla oratoria]|uniref:uncharacterized protein LOC143033946 isoform X2 n=1 Tax=Oratosquilla oratoria TaxID=337810 RepID=UPI003F75FB12
MTWTNRMLLTVVAVLLHICCARACEPDHLVQGCRYDGTTCVCGLGCDTIFRFSTRDECEGALKSADSTEDPPDPDPCRAGRCQHGGICTQSGLAPGFLCQCANTGHYGDRCHLRCPVPDEVPLQEAVQAFPSECVVI